MKAVMGQKKRVLPVDLGKRTPAKALHFGGPLQAFLCLCLSTG